MIRSITKTAQVLAGTLLVIFAITPAFAAKITIYGTGAQVSAGKDPNYTLISAPPPVTVGVHPCATTNSNWLTPPAGLYWDVPYCPQSYTEPVGSYVYETTFDLTGMVPSSAVLTGSAAADDVGEIWLNGVKVANTGGRLTMLPFTITHGLNGAEFKKGLNKLDFVVGNGQSITGVLVQIRGTARPIPQTGGTWQPVGTQPPCGIGATLLLTDGRVLAHCETANMLNWYTLSPDINGDYASGTWAPVASLTNYSPLYFASAVLPDGKVLVEGGEYNPIACGSSPCWTANGALFNPIANGGFGKWTSVSPPPGWSNIGDAQSVVLPSGPFMLANPFTNEQVETTDDGATWTPTGTLKHDRNDEEGWTLLPSADPDAEYVLTVDTYTSGNSTCLPSSKTWSEVYFNGTWVCVGNTPQQLWDDPYTDSNGILRGYEMGPAILRPDGTVFQAGANAHNLNSQGTSAFFDSYTLQWTAGPSFICTLSIGCLGTNFDIADGPAALLPNGNVLMMASPDEDLTPSVFFELQYVTDQLVSFNGPHGIDFNTSSYYGHMLVLPTGQILFTDFSTDVEIYTANDKSYDTVSAPAVTAINGSTCSGNNYWNYFCALPVHNSSPNTITGYRFNGMSQGAAYGDDYQSATNYPLVRLTENQGFTICCTNPPPPKVYYCRTHDHSWMGVATQKLPVSTNFDCPTVPKGQYYLEVVANGISGGSNLVNVQ